MGFIYRGSVGLEKFLLRVFADEWTVTGMENVPLEGRLIVVPNHLSYADPSLVATALPRPVRFLAKASLFEKSIPRWFFTAYGAHPLKRATIDVGAYRWARKLLEADEALVLFPEGTRGKHGLGPGLPGVARLALATGSPLLPVGVTGTNHLGNWYRVLSPTGRIRVNIGRAFTLPEVDGPPDKKTVNDFTGQIMRRIADLLPQSHRGLYADTTPENGGEGEAIPAA